MGTLSNCFRMFVVTVNCLFMIFGLAIFCAGLFLRYGDSVIDSAVSGVESSLNHSLSSAGFGTSGVDANWTSLLFGLALIFTFSGLAVIVITMMGCCGACYKISCILILYTVVSSIVLIGQAVTVGIIYGSPKTIQDPMKTSLKNNIQSDYAGLNGTNQASQVWNIVMQQVKCCGVDSYADFTGATNWIIDYTSNTPPITLKTPLACCKSLPSSEDFTCAGSAASSTDNYLNKGCFDEFWDMIFGNIIITASILGSLGAIQVLLIFFAIIVLCSDNNEKQNKIRPAEKPKKSRRHDNYVKRSNNPKLLLHKS